jgi:GGDEF domain-containing protein
LSEKAKWAGIYLATALLPLFIHFIHPLKNGLLGSPSALQLLKFVPTVGLTLVAVLGWQINQTRIFWTGTFLLGAYAFCLGFLDLGWGSRAFRVSLEVLGAALPLSLVILFLIHETKLWSDRTLARVLLALNPFLLFWTLYQWAPDVYANVVYWGSQPPTGAVRIPSMAWASTALFLAFVHFQRDLKIRPFLISLSTCFIPLLLGLHACHQVLRVANLRPKPGPETWGAAVGLKDLEVTLAFTFLAAILLHSILHMYWRKVYQDILTGVPNRQALDERLHTLTKDYALAMVDIDHFKKFNDTYGHAEGDNVLRMVAQHLEEHLGFRVYRYGGEEFCVVFEGDSLATAEQMMDKTRESLAKRKFRLRQGGRKEPGGFFPKRTSGGKIVHIAVSVGVSAAAKDGSPYEQVIKKADKNLYEAKEKGRNRVVAD